MRTLSETEINILKKVSARTMSSLPDFQRDPDGMVVGTEKVRVQKCFERILRDHHAVGAAMVLVYPDGNTDVFCMGEARRRPVLPVDRETCFRIASITKLVSTFGVLALVEDGLLTLDGDIGHVLGFSLRHPRYPDKPVTLRMLLTHTAGIRNAELQPRDHVPLDVRFQKPELWLETAPGEQFCYTNLGAGLFGAVAEKVAGCSFEEIMQSRVFGPMNICAAYGAAQIPKGKIIADGYSVVWPLPPRKKYDALAQAGQVEIERLGESVVKTVGRLITDSAGIAGFIKLLSGRSEQKVLSAGMLEEMRTCQDGTGGIRHAGRGLNVAFLEDTIPGWSLVGHQGVAYGMCSELFTDPLTGSGVGIMTNGVQLNHMALQRVGLELLTLGFSAIGHMSDR